MSQALLTIVLGAVVASIPPQAPTTAELSGGFVLEAVPLDGGPYPVKRSCLTVRINHSRPALQHFGDEGLCGLDSPGPIAAMVWDIIPVESSDGRKAHILRSRANGKCLVRGKKHPVLQLWGDPADNRWCGLASADALLDDGRAAWRFDDIKLKHQVGRHIGGLRIEMEENLFLAFENGTEGPAEFSEKPDVVTLFRLTPVAP